MSGSVGRGVKAEPNLTPILDMVFQLITFFVLIFNAKQAELAQGVDLPIVGSARPAKFNPDDRVMVFNLKFEDPKKGEESKAPPKRARPMQILIMGESLAEKDLKLKMTAEAQSSMMFWKMTQEEMESGTKELKDIIVIRADKEIPFRLVNNLIAACQEAGFRQFAFKSEGPKIESAKKE